MFGIRFNPKEDVSSSTSLKSSVQRNIRSSILSQITYLSLPAWKDQSAATEASIEHAEPAAEEKEKEEPTSGKGKGGKKGGKGKGGKGKGKDKEEKEEKEDDGEGAGVESVLDEFWPKKEALGLTKW